MVKTVKQTGHTKIKFTKILFKMMTQVLYFFFFFFQILLYNDNTGFPLWLSW